MANEKVISNGYLRFGAEADEAAKVIEALNKKAGKHRYSVPSFFEWLLKSRHNVTVAGVLKGIKMNEAAQYELEHQPTVKLSRKAEIQAILNDVKISPAEKLKLVAELMK